MDLRLRHDLNHTLTLSMLLSYAWRWQGHEPHLHWPLGDLWGESGGGDLFAVRHLPGSFPIRVLVAHPKDSAPVDWMRMSLHCLKVQELSAPHSRKPRLVHGQLHHPRRTHRKSLLSSWSSLYLSDHFSFIRFENMYSAPSRNLLRGAHGSTTA